MMTNAAALALTQLAAARDPMDDLPVGVWIATAFFVVVGLVVMVLYLITLQGAMNSVGEGVRPFNGAFVWFTFIPCVGAIWLMVYIIMLSTALRKECETRGVPGDGAQGISIALVVCYACTMIPYLNFLAILPWLVLWIIHWVKMAEYRRTLGG